MGGEEKDKIGLGLLFCNFKQVENNELFQIEKFSLFHSCLKPHRRVRSLSFLFILTILTNLRQYVIYHFCMVENPSKF